MRRNVWGERFATVWRRQIKNTTINQKRATSTDERWDVTRARWRVQGEHDSIVLGAIELGGGGKLR